MLSNRALAVIAMALSFTGLAGAQLQTYKLDPAHSAAQFSVKHMGISTVRGTFTKVNGTVQYDPADLSKSSIEAVIDAASVDSRVEMRDNDLRSDHFFDVAKYPTLTFKSTRIEAAGPGKLKAVGDLTIHGVTKEVTLEIDGPSQPVKDPKGITHIGASATTTVNRQDFGMSGLQGMIGNDVTLTIDTEMIAGTPTASAPAQ